MENIDLKLVYQWPLRRQVYIFAATAVITLLLGYWWDISSQELKLANARKQENFLKDEVASAIHREQRVTANVARLPAMEAQLSQWKNRLTKQADIPATLNEILKTGSNDHLYFSLFDPQTASTGDIYPVIPVKVVVAASYRQLGDFISQVANLPMLVKIGKFTVSRENTPGMLGQKLSDIANTQNLVTAEFDVEIGLFEDKPFFPVPVNKKKTPNAPT
jgi:type IV pilus assembly protein PilO